MSPNSINLLAAIRWLVSRQIPYSNGEHEDEDGNEASTASPVQDHSLHGLCVSSHDPSARDDTLIGFNGRCNKRADTCYSFWVAASLDMIGEMELIDHSGYRRFLLDKTQHRIGGFGKCPEDPPDIYHSYLGLAALAIVNEAGVKTLDSALCISVEAKNNLANLRKTAWISTKTHCKDEYS